MRPDSTGKQNTSVWRSAWDASCRTKHIAYIASCKFGWQPRGEEASWSLWCHRWRCSSVVTYNPRPSQEAPKFKAGRCDLKNSASKQNGKTNIHGRESGQGTPTELNSRALPIQCSLQLQFSPVKQQKQINGVRDDCLLVFFVLLNPRYL